MSKQIDESSIRLGHHVKNEDFDKIPDGAIGTKDNPFLAAPADFNENGLPYGAWCRCAKCREIGRSTIGFDFYADGPGALLRCETCSRAEWSKRPESAQEIKFNNEQEKMREN